MIEQFFILTINGLWLVNIHPEVILIESEQQEVPERIEADMLLFHPKQKELHICFDFCTRRPARPFQYLELSPDRVTTQGMPAEGDPADIVGTLISMDERRFKLID